MIRQSSVKKTLGGFKVSFLVKKEIILGLLLSTVGEAKKCSVCLSTVSKFRPLSDTYKNNRNLYGCIYPIERAETLNIDEYSCPFCHASDRDRLYALFIGNYLEQIESKGKSIRILDIAPSRPLSKYIVNKLRESNLISIYRTADLYMKDVDEKVDITNMVNFQSSSFDFFICSHVLEHVYDDISAIRELHRILSKGGTGILMVPINLDVEQTDEDPTIDDESERWKRFGQGDHVRIYSRNDFIERISSNGFRVNQSDSNFFGQEVFEKHGIARGSVLYTVEKD